MTAHAGSADWMKALQEETILSLNDAEDTQNAELTDLVAEALDDYGPAERPKRSGLVHAPVEYPELLPLEPTQIVDQVKELFSALQTEEHAAGKRAETDSPSDLSAPAATATNPHFAAVDPVAAAEQAVAQACRVACAAGIQPKVVGIELQHGDLTDPQMRWKLARAAKAASRAVKSLGLDLTVAKLRATSQNLVNTVAVVAGEPLGKLIPAGWNREGLAIMLLGDTNSELGASAWARHYNAEPEDALGVNLPDADLPAEGALARVLLALAGNDLLPSATAVQEGGLAAAILQSCQKFGIGGSIDLGGVCSNWRLSTAEALFSEAPARALIAVPEGVIPAVEAAADAEDVARIRIGTTGGELMVMNGAAKPNPTGAEPLEGDLLVFPLADLA
ncbi:AIR synthase-related protein [Boudabousia marimammalium]|uniref:PurM-like C-terminal domain-containing protein n=1 Tax=Boudabousia marimammalium TaxID=156892 RepID=A0A1Q5PT06_9ACTO|nr:AIR synthase-related protein [Boudabousia marimammalium]OKL50649.1 hypothetical protein BM477_01500 [Boudabousia marimammalium]